MKRRYIFIGDIHGCIDELERLLTKASVGRHDTVVALGDVIGKGPHPNECVKLLSDNDYSAVLGNAELRLLRSTRRRLRLLTRSKREIVSIVESWPYLRDYSAANVIAVHGGVIPGSTIRSMREQESVVTQLRYVRRAGDSWKPVAKNRQRPGDQFWADVWNGPRVVVYGHTPGKRPRITSKTLGIDTGCVYGGKLTAAIFDGDDWELLSVRARRAYAAKG